MEDVNLGIEIESEKTRIGPSRSLRKIRGAQSACSWLELFRHSCSEPTGDCAIDGYFAARPRGDGRFAMWLMGEPKRVEAAGMAGSAGPANVREVIGRNRVRAGAAAQASSPVRSARPSSLFSDIGISPANYPFRPDADCALIAVINPSIFPSPLFLSLQQHRPFRSCAHTPSVHFSSFSASVPRPTPPLTPAN